ncbi:hypothetical protein JQC91_01305 [Jannaschia sp. Os4]|uniref:hypothetical protein n=1 Tax=Jannaschia sp. Os4 TaxID=2807617 RepID=UPI00193A5C04|nr:hypothetical protein [Jannaschia sp. Os4]MBM2574928.1 hypothetical protein [Jannaschia sp. Os4]
MRATVPLLALLLAAPAAAQDALPHLLIEPVEGGLRIVAGATNRTGAPLDAVLEVTRARGGTTSRSRQAVRVPPGTDAASLSTVTVGGSGALSARLTLSRDGEVVAVAETVLSP